ncbi:hypothetical protein J421_0883 [Gemmatirosa kalamazoonensis]|uniref:NfeD-like C-terminal domain-containing protein n=1 Tax=Gemmatirosa kalamazoonensis TaxID=861299 RepID=W0RDM1_9BACT|nr:hypothetical protein [Gemmatirosa kalamazoonensis]AHG88420.1 hypothetical protein J421_0883 [Gemmatirosa kalamazoonensis]
MPTFFLACALLGGGVVLLQLVATLLGLDHDAHDLHAPHAHDAAQGLHLGSLRALSAGLAFFGLTGYGLLRAGWGTPAVLGLSVVAGVAALVVVAVLLRLMLRLESDGTVRIENAVWQPATVYVPIPGARAGAGKVTLSLQGRLVEYQAVTGEGALPTGTPVTVVDVVAPDTLEVVRTPATPLD